VLEDVDGETLLMNLDVRGFAVSTGAACSAGSPEPSPVLLAMGITRAEAQSSLRLSLGWSTTAEDIDAFVETLKAVVERLRGFKHGERFAYGV
jgi:cysteine desulfurase